MLVSIVCGQKNHPFGLRQNQETETVGKILPPVAEPPFLPDRQQQTDLLEYPVEVYDTARRACTYARTERTA